MILLLILLGLITYFILQRTVAPVTTTPIWILWLVMMTPASIWSIWVLIYGEKTPMPPILLIGPFLICPTLYWWLIQVGRRVPSPPPAQPEAIQSQNVESPSQPLRPIDREEETQLRDCFPWSVYYLQNLEYRPQAVICMGQLRSQPEEAYQTIKKNVEALFGDRFLVVFRESFTTAGKPFFVLVPNPYKASDTAQKLESVNRPFFALILLALTLLTTTVVGAEVAGVTDKMVAENPALIFQGLPYAIALIAILGIDEISHYLAARFYKIRTTLPYFIPVPFFLGTFGAFIQMRDPVPNRKALFDMSIAGPIASLLVTIPLLIWGLAHSDVVALPDRAGMLTFQALNPSFSLLLTLLSKLALGAEFTAKTAIALHPVAVAGYVGLIVIAFKLMPVGQLNGGHIAHAMFGQRTSMIIGQIARFVMLILSLLRPELLLWSLLLLLMPIRDEPALNDVSELDNRRDLWGLLSLVVLALIILPVPGAIAQWFNL